MDENLSNLSVIILTIVGVVIQLLFKYFPKLAPWYEKQEQKALIMIGVVLAVTLVYFGLGCFPALADMLGIQVACTLAGAVELGAGFIKILVSQQVTYLLTRKSPSVG